MIDGNRQTGRTYRMMQEVVRQANMGKSVVVIGANHQQTKNLEYLYKGLGGQPGKNIAFLASDDVFPFPGISENTIVFKDHYSTEVKAGKVESLANKLEYIDKELIKVINIIDKIAEIL